MIEELEFLIDDFPGPANQTRCFLHVLNLVVKSIIKQFDLPISEKKKDGNEDGNEDDEDMGDCDLATKELLKLAASGDIEEEEDMTMRGGDEEDATEDDNDEGWVDEHTEMTEGEIIELTESVQPIRLLLTKVSYLLYNITSLSNFFSAAKGCICN